MKISIIVAHDQNNVIGINGKMPWHISEDLKRFKKLTMGKPIIMGRKTHESLGSKALPGRLNIVISSGAKSGVYLRDSEVMWSDALPTALNYLEVVQGCEEVFIIGGERLYQDATPVADTIYRTVVRMDTPITISDSDEVVYFPCKRLHWSEWRLCETTPAPDPNAIAQFQIWRREECLTPCH